MKVCLLFPKSTFLNNPIMWPPLGLMYLSSQLRAQGHETFFCDLNFDPMPEDGEFDQLWVSSTSPQMAETKRIGEICRDWQHTSTVLGGAGAWANPETHKVLPYNVIVSGESDHPDTVRQIVEMARVGGHEHISPPITRSMDWVLPPDRRWANKYHSYMADREGNQHRMSSLFCSRGCPLECSFCESGRHGIIWDRLTRYESLELVEYQIKECQELGFTGLAYYDDVFILNKKRTMAMLEIHKKYNMVFRCFLRSDILCNHGGYEYLKAMQEGGLIEIFVGVESADNQIKDNIHKKTTIEQDTSVLEWCRELGIRCKMSFILGLPGESMESMETTRQWILKHRPHRVQVDRLIPFPGTPLTKNPEEYDLIWERQVDDEYFYKGREDLDVSSFVSTSHLTREQIDTFWKNLEIELKKEGIIG